MKKIFSIILSICLIISILVGCQNEQKVQQKDNGYIQDTSKEIDSIMTPIGTLPIVKEKITLTVATHTKSSEVDDFANNEFTKWLEEKTNIHIEWITADKGEYKSKLNLLIAGGDYPDIIMRSNFSIGEQVLYEEQGILTPLNDLIEKYAQNTKNIFEQYPDIKDVFTLSNGDIVALPLISDVYHTTMSQKMWVYKPWLDKLGLEVPTTTEEYYQMLKAFKEQDPNGNGIDDEIPLAGSTIKDMTLVGYLMNPFIYSPYDNKTPSSRLILQDGKVVAPYYEEEWKEGLKYIHKLYSEGLIAPESFVQNKNQMIQLGENPDVAILGSVPARFPLHFAHVGGESRRWLEYTTIPPLEGPGGQRIARYQPVVGEAAFHITSKCEYPEIAMRLADLLYDEEIMMRSIFGVPGVDWDKADEGQIAVTGEQAKYKLLRPKSEVPINSHWAQGSHSCRSGEFSLSWVMNEDNMLDKLLYEETLNNYEDYKAPHDMIFPEIYTTKEQSEEIVDIEMALEQFVNEMTINFIIGVSDIEKEWNGYLKELENIGIKRYLELYQQAYESK
ncbi:MAG: extracellular solute-binding protein [Vallitalea sp.]|jgi:putative aldouronate transport system substrate-binding protein|nr:extracellular solute-binding protein [Vallitalea sp.]